MKKRGLRWVWAAVAAFVALVALALFTRVQPPYDFLRGAELKRTEIKHDAFTGDYAALSYNATGFLSVYAQAEKELLPNGWTNEGGQFFGPRGSNTSIGFYATDTTYYGTDAPPFRIYFCRPPTTIDRFNAWLDRVTGR